MNSSRFVLLSAVLASLLYTEPVSAQWVEGPGRGWASLTVYHQDTRSAFDLNGERGDFAGAGHAVTSASFFTVARGLFTGVDGWAQFSFQRLQFEDVTGPSTSTGPGDIRLFLRASPLSLVGSTFPLAIRIGTKLPVGDFDVGSMVIPLGDGQRDWEAMVEVGHSFYPRDLYVMAWAGYRWRESRDEGRLDFGDERFFYAAVGGSADVVDFKVALEGTYGDTPLFSSVLATGAERELLRLSPSLLIDLGPGQVELGARLPISGQNLPAGPDLVVGYFTKIGG